MPIYEYRCRKCGETFEELVLGSNGGASIKCRACSSRRVQKVLSAFAVHAGAEHAPTPESPCASCGAEQRGMCGVD